MLPLNYRRWIIFGVSVLPLLWLVWCALAGRLGADPAQAIVVFCGTWTMYFLLATLAVTPVRRLLQFSPLPWLQGRWLQPHRRMLGLFTLFYAVLHVLAYGIFMVGGDVRVFFRELVERPYILVSIPAMLLLLLLGITSTQTMMRRLGAHWQRLHKSIYLIALLAWVHVFMQVRSSYYLAFIYGTFILLLLGIRFYGYMQGRHRLIKTI